MKVYVMMVEDKHINYKLSVFATAEAAIASAEREVESWSSCYAYEAGVGDVEMATGHWLYYVHLSGEGSCVHVQGVELQS